MDGAMDGEVRNEPMLLKIAALLVTLSLVAERAAGRSWPVRFLLLLILRRADAAATAFVARETEAVGASGDDLPWLDDAAERGASPLDAAFLALRFRLLAEVLGLCRAAWRTDDTAGDWAGNWVRSGNTSGNRARSGNTSGVTAGNGALHPATQFPILLLLFPARRGLPVHDTS